ncbi:hypothetical protein LTR37_001199 [Vermiconidia calcicola]|uniref:Uncharacterized protein n=1 Tax=Vermiconidia calcicola TaxID=1690605 RepID=A0ACC3NVS8_9PEZI|nr:hypothetical protein LTR37_001199 [Vermiconidia calcicola]
MASKWIPSLRRHKKEEDTTSTQETGTPEETNTQQEDTSTSAPQDVKSEGENPTQQEPVLNSDDQKFLENEISTDEAAQQSQGEPVMKISDDGEMKEASKEEQEQAGDSVIVPETKPEASNEGAQTAEQQQAGDKEDPPETLPEASKEGTQDTKAGSASDSVAAPDTQPADMSKDSTQDVRQKQSEDSAPAPESKTETGDDGVQGQETEQSYDDVMKEKAAEAKNSRKSKKDKSFDLPSQEEAEAATKKGLDEQATQEGDTAQGGKRTWTSYIPSVRPSSSSAKKSEATETSKEGESGDSSAPQGEASEGTAATEDSTQRTWKDYASTYVPSIPSISTSWKSSRTGKDAQPEVVYNEDGTVNEDATQDKQEREISALLSNLNLNAFNNRVFAVSGETQKYYERFAQCLKDIINGAPTAYQDLDQLMHEAGPQLQKQFDSMPPFLQTLVKSLPMKMGPEIMAAASEKPGDDMKKRMEAASQRPATGESDAGLPGDAFGTAEKEEGGDEKEGQQKKKRTIPGLKSLVGEKSAVSSMLRAAVSFLQTRFPFLASMTNVIMSLAVFILMFVFWYCHKRGKEVRLAREAEGKELKEGEEDEVLEVSGDEAEVEDDDPELSKQIEEAAKSLSQPTSTEAPVSDTEKGGEGKVAETEKVGAEEAGAEEAGGEKGLKTGAEKAGGDKGAELEAEKAVGV